MMRKLSLVFPKPVGPGPSSALVGPHESNVADNQRFWTTEKRPSTWLSSSLPRRRCRDSGAAGTTVRRQTQARSRAAGSAACRPPADCPRACSQAQGSRCDPAQAASVRATRARLGFGQGGGSARQSSASHPTDSASAAAIRRVDAILSAQLADSYKPDPRAYSRAVELLGCEPGQAAMVAAHGGDLVAAARVGLRPIFVRRPQEWGPGGGEEPPTGLPGLVVADGLEHLADLLGC
jgi:hypothetical protein